MIVLSLGAGVQSSTLLLMAANGLLGEKPDFAIFADTGAEPKAVYEYLDFLTQEVGEVIPIRTVSAGSLYKDTLDAVAGKRKRVAQAPFHVINRAGMDNMPPDTGGMLWRKCTVDYKLVPLRRAVREILKANGEKHCRQWLGITRDEADRMKPSGRRYMTNEYPLVDRSMTRNDCLLYLERNGYPRPPKSACVFCPYRSGAAWRDMKRNQPDDFASAVEFDQKLREGKLPGVTGDAYVHRSFIPLSEVNFDRAYKDDQRDLFGNECTGLCGV